MGWECNVVGGLSPRSTTEWASSLRSQLHSWRFRGPQPQPLASDIVILQILIYIISLEPGRFSVQKARMNTNSDNS